MTEKSELTYWIGVSHLPRWTSERTNKFIIQILHEKKLNWNEFFQLDRNGWTDLYDLNEKEINDLENVKNEIPKLSFISERLINEGFDIIPINSSEYPKILKENLKIKNSPPIIYTKGYKKILSEDTVAIVGSRKAGNQALNFTNEIAKQCVENKKVIVSGFAKGVDKQALDSAISYNGKSIIVLPQGILTFQTGYKNYYESIVNGNVLVLSTFFPLAGWEVGLAMARNTYIYGLAQEIFVAESEESGGTWQGALDGLKRKRKVYVRVPEKDEKNANQCVENKKVIVSGFAKGVDKQALDSAISYNGKSIIVLPQGILTFQTGYKNYYESIVNGNVLVLSTFFPLAGWEVGLAMARNTYIYGLAQEIFVAESEESGGTWQGALDGLKRKRKVYVRVPEKDEKNANLKLIELGAIPVNLNLETKKLEYSIKSENKENEIHLEVNETVNDFGIKNSNFEENLVALLKLGEFTSKEISLKLKIDWNIKKLTDYLKKNPNIKVIKGKPYKFTIAEVFSPSMF